MPRRKRYTLVIVIIATLVVAAVVAERRQSRPYEYSDLADVRWMTGGTPGTARVTVRDPAGKAVAGVKVHVANYSGGSGDITNASGVAEIPLGEPEFLGLSLDEKYVVVRKYAYWLGTPNVSNGLLIEVVKKQ